MTDMGLEFGYGIISQVTRTEEELSDSMRGGRDCHCGHFLLSLSHVLSTLKLGHAWNQLLDCVCHY
jgi:hypothetical protein